MIGNQGRKARTIDLETTAPRVTWRVAPGCYEAGLRPLRPFPIEMQSAESASSYQRGAKSRDFVNDWEPRAESPYHEELRGITCGADTLTKSRSG